VASGEIPSRCAHEVATYRAADGVCCRLPPVRARPHDIVLAQKLKGIVGFAGPRLGPRPGQP
jgi:hypothetical protein